MITAISSLTYISFNIDDTTDNIEYNGPIDSEWPVVWI